MKDLQPLTKLPDRCPYCGNTRFIKRGLRQKKHGSIQIWKCSTCKHSFTAELVKGKSYPTRLIANALSLYEQGFTMRETLTRIHHTYGMRPSENTVWNWLLDYKDLCTYHKFRAEIRRAFRPQAIIRSVKLYHTQVYKFSIHRGKLATLLDQGEHRDFKAIGEYLERMQRECPHELFRDDGRPRASKSGMAFDLSGVVIEEKQNNATNMARFVLSSVANNRLRHESLQHFMLSCDSATVAVEIPIVLRPEDIASFQALHFDIPIATDKPVTGHIDFLQIRNGLIHILDYKPDARTNRPVEQLTLYALAVSRATGIRLYNFKCAWFNEETFCEFYPLHVVYKRARKIA